MGMGMGMGGAITAVAATIMVGTAATTTVGGIIAIGGDFHVKPKKRKAASLAAFSFRECQPLCRFSDAGMPELSPRSDSRRPKSAKAGNRGKWGSDGAAGAMGIWRRRECWGS